MALPFFPFPYLIPPFARSQQHTTLQVNRRSTNLIHLQSSFCVSLISVDSFICLFFAHFRRQLGVVFWSSHPLLQWPSSDTNNRKVGRLLYFLLRKSCFGIVCQQLTLCSFFILFDILPFQESRLTPVFQSFPYRIRRRLWPTFGNSPVCSRMTPSSRRLRRWALEAL